MPHEPVPSLTAWRRKLAVLATVSRRRQAEPADAAELVAEISEQWREWGARIGKVMRLRHFGIDLRGVGPRDDPDGATILEVNASPLLLGMYQAGHREAALAAQARVLEATWIADAPFA